MHARMSIVNNNGYETIFYFTKPLQKRFPIAVLCEGATSPDDIESVWQFTQLEQFRGLKESFGILAIEKNGVDAGKIDRDRFFANYTRSNRFRDHASVIDHLLKNPPVGFDGRLIFIGVSEGGPLANQLSIYYPKLLPPSTGLGLMIALARRDLGLGTADEKRASIFILALCPVEQCAEKSRGFR